MDKGYRWPRVYTSSMALSIKSERADRLARELAAATGESLTSAVEAALEERLQREHARRGPGLGARLRRLQADVARTPVVDPRSPDEIVGYDHNGLPA